MSTAVEQLQDTIAAYNDAWNAHDVERIASMHAPDMVFENHTAGERAEGEKALGHIARIFESWPDIEFKTRRLYVREDLVVQEWTHMPRTSSRSAAGRSSPSPPAGASNGTAWM